LGINFSIFNAHSSRTQWERAKVNVRQLHLQDEQENLNLKTNIYNAYQDAFSSLQKYNASKRTVEYSQKALDISKRRYDIGLLGTLDYIITQNNLYLAQIEEVSNHYDFVFKMKVLEFYKGRELNYSDLAHFQNPTETNSPGMNKKLIWIIVGLVVVIVTLILLKKNGVIGKAEGIKVTAEKVVNRTITETVNASGKVYPEIEVKVSPDISGEIVELNVEEGDSVRKGQVLARIYADIYSSQRDQAAAGVIQTQAQVLNSTAQLEALKATLDQAEVNITVKSNCWMIRLFQGQNLNKPTRR
jgi:biotin carboxyl carrier protein